MPAAPALMTERRPARAAERKGSCLRRMSSNHLRGGGGEQGWNTRRRSGLPGKDGERGEGSRAGTQEGGQGCQVRTGR